MLAKYEFLCTVAESVGQHMVISTESFTFQLTSIPYYLLNLAYISKSVDCSCSLTVKKQFILILHLCNIFESKYICFNTCISWHDFQICMWPTSFLLLLLLYTHTCLGCKVHFTFKYCETFIGQWVSSLIIGYAHISKISYTISCKNFAFENNVSNVRRKKWCWLQ